MAANLEQVEALFCEALELASADERAAYLDRACAGDNELRRQVETLLEAQYRAGSFLEAPIVTIGQSPEAEDQGSVIGPYKLMEQIGEGGMGVVYVAHQSQPVRRKVALKVIKPGMDTRQMVARFEAERQALALMDHPNIARVLDGGATESGRPYFVMELVRGIPITDYCDREQLSIPERLGLFVTVCRAVQHAHQKGIIHRDLKPNNVLVTLHDGEPVPKIIDFGIAKATGQSLTDKTLYTGFSQLVGTPLYMSPEQAELSGLDIDTRSDIYSLGVLMYELLTGTTPFDAERLRKADFDEVRRIIREEEPPTPSTRLSSLATTRATAPSNRKAGARHPDRAGGGELDWIVMKALEKDRRRRYETTNDFAADVVRYLTDRPVEACPPSAWYRFAKYARRNRAALTTAGLLTSALVAGTAVSTWQALRASDASRIAVGALAQVNANFKEANEQRNRAELITAESRRRQVRLYLEQGTRLMNDGDLSGSLPYFVEALRLEGNHPGRTEDHRLRLGTILAQCPKPARIWFHDQSIRDVCYRRDGSAVGVALKDGTVSIYDVTTGDRLGPILKHPDRVDCVDFSPDGHRLITACLDRRARIWDVATGREVVPPMEHPGGVRWVLFSPDGRLVATAARGRNAGEPIDIDFLCRVWDTATGRPVLDRFLPHFRHRVIFSPDSRSIVLCYPSNTLRILDARTAQPTMPPVRFTTEIFGDLYREHSFSPDGRLLAIDVLDRTSRVLDTKTGAEVASSPRPPFHSVGSSISRDGRWVVTSCLDGTARVWNATNGTSRFDPIRHPAAVHNAIISPDGRLVATNCIDHAVRIWHAETGQLVLPPLWHLAGALEEHRLFFSPDSRFLLTASVDHSVRLWDLASANLGGRQRPGVVDVPGTPVVHMEFRPNGHSLVTAGDGTARVRDAATGAELGVAMIHPRGVIGAARLSPDGRSLLTLSCTPSSPTPFEAWIWDLETHTAKVGPMRHPIEGVSNGWLGGIGPLVAWSPDGLRIATSSGPNRYLNPVPFSVCVWDAQNGTPVTPLIRFDVPVFALEFSPDGQSLVTASGSLLDRGRSGEARILNATTGEPRMAPIRTPQVCRAARFSPDGRRFVIGSGTGIGGEGEVRVCDPVTGQPLTPPMPHPAAVTWVAFSPDGRLILTACEDNATRLWAAATGTQVVNPMRQAGALGFSPDGRRVLASSSRGGLQLWDVATGLAVTPPLWPGFLDARACFSQDGRRVAAKLKGGGAVIWAPLPDERPLEDQDRLAMVLSGARVDESGAAIPLSMSEVQQAYEALVRKAPDTFQASPDQLERWHEQRAGECEVAKDWTNAITHLDYVIDRDANDPFLRFRRGMAHAELEHWTEAVGDLDIHKLKPGDGVFVWYRSALVQLAAGKRDAYRSACAAMLQHFGGPDSSGEPADFTGWTIALAPDALDDLAPALTLAERSATGSPDDSMALSTLGALYYRAGRYNEALEWLGKADAGAVRPTTSPIYHQLFLAMAHHRLGHADEARRCFDQAAAGIDKAVAEHGRDTQPLALQRRLTLTLIRKEAEAVLGEEHRD